jgi:hypothetical protein
MDLPNLPTTIEELGKYLYEYRNTRPHARFLLPRLTMKRVAKIAEENGWVVTWKHTTYLVNTKKIGQIYVQNPACRTFKQFKATLGDKTVERCYPENAVCRVAEDIVFHSHTII